MLYGIIQNNYACIIVCLLFVVFILLDRSFDLKVSALFLIATLIVITLTVVDNLELYEAQFAAPTAARRIYSAIGYSLRPLEALIVVFIIRRNKPNARKQLPLHLLLLSPFVVNTVVAFISVFNGCMFDYSSDNKFLRGPLGMLPFIVSGFYVVCLVLYSVTILKTRQRSETIIVFIIAILCGAGTALESIYKFDAILNTSCIIGVVFYYLYLHVTVYSTDTLTKAYSRRIFFLDISKLRCREAIIVELDLNNLKQVNDEFGHASGDATLILFTKAVQKNLAPYCTLYRMGGDEFTIIFRNSSAEAVEKTMSRIAADVSAASLSFAYGYAPFRRGDDIEKVCETADSRMYAKKAEMKTPHSEHN